MESQVLVVNYSGHDLSSASKYGKLTFLTEGRDVNIFDTDGRILDLRQKLKGAKEGDFILLSGSPILNMIVGHLMMLKFGVVKVLIFNNKTREYVARTITETQLQQIN